MSGSQQLLLGGSVQQAVDPFFYSVTSLLHGDGTNGGQNNTFLDSSTNNFTITRNGNTTQGSFSPFSQTGWSNYFDGTGDSIKISSGITNQFAPGSAFTCEGWFYLNNSSASQMLFCVGGSTVDWNATTGILFQIYLFSGTLYWQSNAGGSANSLSGTCPSLNAWHHIAVGYNGTTTRVWIDGTSFASGTPSYSVPSYSNAMVGGDVNNGNTFYGYASNVRFVKGTDVYGAGNTSITVPTTPLTAITNTQLLTCQANRFLDASSNNFTITRNGDVSVQPFSPFNPTTAYSTSAVGGSGYFDGSGDYLSVANSALLNLASTFSLEFWIYRTASNNQIFVSRGGGAANWSLTDGLQYGCFIESSTFYFQFNSGGSPVSLFATATLPPLNAWSHVAIARNGTTMRGWLNGVSLGTSTSTPSIPTTTNLTYLGNGVQTTLPFTGYMAGVRLIQGSSAYDASSSTITVPTAPVEAITNTSLLCNFTNGAIFDNAAVADYETVGNAQISTSVKKYGTGSIAFDGTGDYLVTDAPSTQLMTFGTGDFTIECWAYATSLPGSTVVFIDFRPSGTEGLYPTIYFNVGGVLTYFTNSADRIVGPALAVNTWYHIAVCRVAGQTKMFLNGTQVGSTYADTNNYVCGSQRPAYATWGKTLGSNNYTGYIDDLRISKGVGRYPYNFTPPTAALPDIGGTVTLTADPYFDYTTLLLPGNGTNGAQNNTFLDSSSNAFSITRNGNTTQGTFSPFSQTGWGNYFDGTGDWLSLASNSAFNLGTGEFTVECWVYLTNPAGNSGYQMIINRTNLSGGTGWGLWVQAQKFGFWMNAATTQVNDPGSITANTWTHLAAVRNSSNLVTLYVNGTSVASTTVSSFTDSTTALGIGARGETGSWNAEYGVFGYISNARIVKGTAVYTANFTPPTTPLTAITNTSLLTCQSNRFIDNSSNAFAITRNGDVSVQAFSPFNPTAAWSAATYGGSGYFDGSGDYLTVPDNVAFTMGTGDFSVECWYYTTSSNRQLIIAQSNAAGSTLSFWMEKNASNQLRLVVTVGGVQYVATATATISLSSWNFLQLVRSGTTVFGYQNGTQVCSVSVGSGSLLDSADVVEIGGGTVGLPVVGYVSSLRILKGTASAATVPTAPLTAITNTQLLCNFTNAGIYDATSKNNLETVGNAQISTTQSKFGGSSMYFDGSGDYLLGPWNPLTDLGAGDFTIEFWMYPTAVGQSSVTYLFNLSTSGAYGPILIGQAASGYGIVLYSSSTGSSWNLASGSSFGTATANAWNHVALTRYGADVRLFLNGVVGTTLNWGTTALLTGSTYRTNIGSATGVANTFYTGYIDDLRVTRGIARYTSNFTPPTTAFLTL